MAKCAPSAAAKVANLWPGMSGPTSIQFTRLGRGLPISRPNQFAQIHSRYYHQQAYNTAGVSQLTFFNVGASEHVSNMNNGVVPDDRPFWLTGLCVTFQNLTAAGAASGGINAADDLSTMATRADEVRKILEGGLLQLRIGDRMILETQDLTHFPSDGGFYVSAAGQGVPAAGAGKGAFVNYTNGEPISGNRFRFPAPYPVLPGKPVSVILKWQSLLTITTNAGRIKVELVGETVSPLNA